MHVVDLNDGRPHDPRPRAGRPVALPAPAAARPGRGGAAAGRRRRVRRLRRRGRGHGGDRRRRLRARRRATRSRCCAAPGRRSRPARRASPCTSRQSMPRRADGRTAVGVVGLGAMGGPMTARLLDPGGFPVVACDRVAERSAAAAVARGATPAPTPAAVAAASDVVITMLPDDAAVVEAVTGPDGVLEGARRRHPDRDEHHRPRHQPAAARAGARGRRPDARRRGGAHVRARRAGRAEPHGRRRRGPPGGGPARPGADGDDHHALRSGRRGQHHEAREQPADDHHRGRQRRGARRWPSAPGCRRTSCCASCSPARRPTPTSRSPTRRRRWPAT